MSEQMGVPTSKKEIKDGIDEHEELKHTGKELAKQLVMEDDYEYYDRFSGEALKMELQLAIDMFLSNRQYYIDMKKSGKAEGWFYIGDSYEWIDKIELLQAMLEERGVVYNEYKLPKIIENAEYLDWRKLDYSEGFLVDEAYKDMGEGEFIRERYRRFYEVKE